MLWLCKERKETTWKNSDLVIVHIWHLTILINYHKSQSKEIELNAMEKV